MKLGAGGESENQSFTTEKDEQINNQFDKCSARGAQIAKRP